MRALIFAAATLALGATAHAADCNALRQLASVPMELEKEGGRPVITATVNGTPRKLLLDTGGVITQLTPRTVMELNLATIDSDFVLVDVSGKKSNRAVRVKEFGLGGMVAKSSTIQVSDLASAAGEGLDGLLSTDFLYRSDIELDFRAGKMNMFDPEHCEGRVVYWPATAVAEVPIYFINAHIVLPVTLDGREMHALIDTGADKTTLEMGAAKRMLGVDPVADGTKQEGTINGDETLTVYPHVFDSLTFAGVQLRKPHIMISPDHSDRQRKKDDSQSIFEYRSIHRDGTAIDPDLVLGMDYLRRFHIYIAYKERKLYITAADYKSPAEPAKP